MEHHDNDTAAGSQHMFQANWNPCLPSVCNNNGTSDLSPVVFSFDCNQEPRIKI